MHREYARLRGALAQLRVHLSELVGRVARHHERVTVTKRGASSAALVEPEDPESLEETLAILSDPAVTRRMAESDAELAMGRGESREALTEAISRRPGR